MTAKDLATLKSFEALEETIRRDTVEIARALHQSLSLVTKWKERPATDEDFQQSGARNPLDRLEIIIQTIEKFDPERAYVPIEWLCARFGFMPPVKMPEGKGTDADIMQALLRWNREFGETAKEISIALKDGTVTGKEFKRVSREFTESIQAGMALLIRIKEKMDE